MKKQLDYSRLSNAYLLTYKTAMDACGYTIEHHPKDSPYHKLYNEFDIAVGKDVGILPLFAYRDIKNDEKILYLSENYIDEIKSYKYKQIIYWYDRIFNKGYKYLYLIEEKYKSSDYCTVFGFCSKERLKNDVVNGGYYNAEVKITYTGIYVWKKVSLYKWKQLSIFIYSPTITHLREYFQNTEGSIYYKLSGK